MSGAREEKAKHALTIKALVEEQGRLEHARAELLKASTAVECMNALRSFEVTDLGNGHVAGGTAEHVRNRMNVLNRSHECAGQIEAAVLTLES